MDFVAIDFETANRCRESACAIGLTYVENMVIVDQEYHLIQPTPFYFDTINQSVHGISKEQVVNAPTFDKVWAKIKDKVQQKQLVAHNASFDFSVLRYALSAYKIPFPDITYGCTLQLFRKLSLPIENNKLSTLARYYNLSLDHHHALSDAVVCAQIAIALMKDLHLSDLTNLAGHFGYQLGSISQTSVTPFTKLKKSIKCRENLSKAFEERNHTYLSKRQQFLNRKTDIVSNKKVIISGSFQKVERSTLAEYIEHNGGKLQTSVSSKTDILIYGQNMGPMKKAKAHHLGIPMISEEEFLGLLG
jgi:DNA polymerase III subunit epsilon